MQSGGVLDYFNYSKMSPEQARYNLQLVNISRDSGKTFGRWYSTWRPEWSPGDKIEDISPKAYGEPGNARLLTWPEEFPGDSVLVGYPVERTLYDRSVINNKMPGWENARNKWFELIRSNTFFS